MSAFEWEILAADRPEVAELGRFDGERYAAWQRHWDALGEEHKDPFTHPVWSISWLIHLATPEHRLFLARREGEVRFGIPFEVVPRWTPLGRRCGLVHDDDYVIEGASVAGAPDEVEAAFAALFRTEVERFGKPLGIRLAKVDRSHALVRDGHAQQALRGARSVLDIREGWDGLIEGLSKNFKGNLRKSRNRLEKLGDVEVDHLTHADDLAAGLDRLAALEARSWKGREGSSIGDNSKMQAFLSATLPGFAARDEAIVQCLRVGDRDIAAQLCLRLGRTLHVLKIGYDEEQARLSPGNLLLERVIREWCPDQAIDEVSLVTLQPWHDKWKPDYRTTHRLQWFAPGFSGLLARTTELSARERAKQFMVARGWRKAITIP